MNRPTAAACRTLTLAGPSRGRRLAGVRAGPVDGGGRWIHGPRRHPSGLVLLLAVGAYLLGVGAVVKLLAAVAEVRLTRGGQHLRRRPRPPASDPVRSRDGRHRSTRRRPIAHGRRHPDVRQAPLGNEREHRPDANRRRAAERASKGPPQVNVRQTFSHWAQSADGAFTLWEAASMGLLFVRWIVSHRSTDRGPKQKKDASELPLDL